MDHVTPNRAAMFMAFGLASYAFLVLAVDPLVLRDLAHSLAFGVASVVAVTWAPAATRAIRKGRGADWLVVLAVFISALTIAFSRILAIFIIYMGRPTWLIEGPISSFIPYSIALSFSLFLIAPGVAPGANIGYWKHLAIAGVLSGLATGFVIGQLVSL